MFIVAFLPLQLKEGWKEEEPRRGSASSVPLPSEPQRPCADITCLRTVSTKTVKSSNQRRNLPRNNAPHARKTSATSMPTVPVARRRRKKGRQQHRSHRQSKELRRPLQRRLLSLAHRRQPRLRQRQRPWRTKVSWRCINNFSLAEAAVSRKLKKTWGRFLKIFNNQSIFCYHVFKRIPTHVN